VHAEILADLGLNERATRAYQDCAHHAATPSEREAVAAALDALAKRPPAERDANGEEKNRALRLYRDGVNLRLVGDHEQALKQLRRSYALWPHPLTIVQIGQVHRATGREVEYRKANARLLALSEERAGTRVKMVLRHESEKVSERAVKALSFSPGGNALAADWNRLKYTKQVALSEGRIVQVEVSSVVFSPDGTRMGWPKRAAKRTWR